MEVLHSIAATRERLEDARREGAVIGLVPTMGYLHDGHVSLMGRAVADCDLVLTTIFVNPLQFAPDEDLASYPRDLESDTDRCRAAGVALVLAPSVAEMYPEPVVLTTVAVSEISGPLEGEHRPTHFAGVATVVAKLFNIAGPCRAYFGEKDWQQLKIIERMALDLSFPVEVVGCPIVREPDGLAMSSRNVFLDPDERQAAAVVSRALRAGREMIDAGERGRRAVEARMREVLGAESRAQPEYIVAVDAATLQPVDPLRGHIRFLTAVRVGPTRLIDNVGVELPAA